MAVISVLSLTRGLILFGPVTKAFVIPKSLVNNRQLAKSVTKPAASTLSDYLIYHDTDELLIENALDYNDFLMKERQMLKEEIIEKSDAYQRLKEVMDKHHLEENEKEDASETNRDAKDANNYVWKLLIKIVTKITKSKKLKKRGGVKDIVNSRTLGTQTLDVGETGNSIISLAEKLAELNPTSIPTRGWKGYGGGSPSECPLRGSWKLRFTTAADASFPESPARGKAVTSQEIDARAGTLTNVVDFERGKVKGFRVVVGGEAVSDDEIDLSFREVVILRESRFPRLFGRVALRIPARLFRAVNKFFSRGNKNTRGPYFKLMYIDDDFRMHKTGEGNWFIQTRLA